MHRVLCFLFSLLFLSNALAKSEKRLEPAIGDLTVQQLFTYYPIFKQGYADYQPSAKELTASQTLKGKSILVMFGVWCHDSEREIPRLLKLLDASSVQLASLKLRALNYSKQDPDGLHHTYNLQSTPTIVLFDGTKELGRIVEYPKMSLGEDLAKMITQ